MQRRSSRARKHITMRSKGTALGENTIKTLLKVICFLLVPAIVYADDQESMKKEESMKFGMQAVLTAAEGKGKELADIMLQASRAVSTLDGCELYIVQTSLTDESKILVTEVWESKEAHQGSLANEKVRELIGKAKPIIVGMEHHPAIFVGGHGL